MDASQANQEYMEPTEHELLAELRRIRRSLQLQPPDDPLPAEMLNIGQRVADAVASGMGSWTFIIVQSTILVFWIAVNLMGVLKAWDPYPFILLNLALSFQAAYGAPIIMMSQNRQQDIDRMAAGNDHKVNVKAELEIELLHEKIDQLRAQEVLNLTKSVKYLTELLMQSGNAGRDPHEKGKRIL